MSYRWKRVFIPVRRGPWSYGRIRYGAHVVGDLGRRLPTLAVALLLFTLGVAAAGSSSPAPGDLAAANTPEASGTFAFAARSGPAKERPSKKAAPRVTARPVEKDPAPADGSHALPAPGACADVQPSVKVCSLDHGTGSFDVVTFPPALVLLTFEEEVKDVNPPDDRYYQTDRKGNTVTVAPLVEKLPARTPMVVILPSATITISLRPGSLERVDTQVIVKDPARAAENAEVERRVREKTESLEAGFETRASARADAVLLADLATYGIEVRGVGGKGIASNASLIVLTGDRAVRVGARRYLLVTLENRSDRVFEVKDVTLALEDGSGTRPVKTSFRFASTKIAPGDEARGAVLVPLRGATSAKARLRVTVVERDASRSVSLGGMRVP